MKNIRAVVLLIAVFGSSQVSADDGYWYRWIGEDNTETGECPCGGDQDANNVLHCHLPCYSYGDGPCGSCDFVGFSVFAQHGPLPGPADCSSSDPQFNCEVGTYQSCGTDGVEECVPLEQWIDLGQTHVCGA